MGDMFAFSDLIQAIELLVTVCNWDHQGRLPGSYFTITTVIMSDAFSMGSIGSFFLHFVIYNPLFVVWFFLFINIQKQWVNLSLLPTPDAFPLTYLQLLLHIFNKEPISLSIIHKKDKIKKRISSCRHFAGSMCMQFSLLLGYVIGIAEIYAIVNEGIGNGEMCVKWDITVSY